MQSGGKPIRIITKELTSAAEIPSRIETCASFASVSILAPQLKLMVEIQDGDSHSCSSTFSLPWETSTIKEIFALELSLHPDANDFTSLGVFLAAKVDSSVEIAHALLDATTFGSHSQENVHFHKMKLPAFENVDLVAVSGGRGIAVVVDCARGSAVVCLDGRMEDDDGASDDD